MKWNFSQIGGLSDLISSGNDMQVQNSNSPLKTHYDYYELQSAIWECNNIDFNLVKNDVKKNIFHEYRTINPESFNLLL